MFAHLRNVSFNLNQLAGVAGVYVYFLSSVWIVLKYCLFEVFSHWLFHAELLFPLVRFVFTIVSFVVSLYTLALKASCGYNGRQCQREEVAVWDSGVPVGVNNGSHTETGGEHRENLQEGPWRGRVHWGECMTYFDTCVRGGPTSRRGDVSVAFIFSCQGNGLLKQRKLFPKLWNFDRDFSINSTLWQSICFLFFQ